MSKILQYIIFMASVIGVLFASGFLYANDDCNINSQESPATFIRICSNGISNIIPPGNGDDGVGNIKKLIVSVGQKAIGFGALFAIGAIVLSGILYTTSYGDDEKVKKAKTTAIYSVIGLVLLLVSFPMVNIVVNFVYSLGEK